MMMIQHCQTNDLNPFAKGVVIEAMEKRIAEAKKTIDRRLETQRDKGALWYDKKFLKTGKVEQIPRRFLVWDEHHMSFYDVIKDAENRIKELKT